MTPEEALQKILKGNFAKKELPELFWVLRQDDGLATSLLVQIPEYVAERIPDKLVDSLAWSLADHVPFDTPYRSRYVYQKVYSVCRFLTYAPPWVVNKLAQTTFEALVDFLILERVYVVTLLWQLPEHVAAAIPDSSLTELVQWAVEIDLGLPERILYEAPMYIIRRLHTRDIRLLAGAALRMPETAAQVLCRAPEYVIWQLTSDQLRSLVEAVASSPKYSARVLQEMPEYTQNWLGELIKKLRNAAQGKE